MMRTDWLKLNYCESSQAVVRRCSSQRLFLEISQKSQGSIYAGSLFNKFTGLK